MKGMTSAAIKAPQHDGFGMVWDPQGLDTHSQASRNSTIAARNPEPQIQISTTA